MVKPVIKKPIPEELAIPDSIINYAIIMLSVSAQVAKSVFKYFLITKQKDYPHLCR